MHIDWFTVVAQALNFLVLMWLLKRFLYQPVLNAIAAREKHIEDQLSSARVTETRARKEFESFRQKNATFDQQQADRSNAARADADALRNKRLKEAQDAADTLSSHRKAALQTELDDLGNTILVQTKERVFAVAAKVLADLADTSLEERMIAVFLLNLQLFNKQDHSLQSSDMAVIASAFELSHAQKKALKDEIRAEALTFRVVPQLLSGVELLVNGHKLAWSIRDYLGQIEQESSHVG